ncbi:hypothetical protein GCM10022631_10990 [Deinococcus rubellus]|uniref:hypothetical protein n=1 Tax=Deinococcus rubellus TaxID=1889240 RepID=UPI0031E60BB8
MTHEPAGLRLSALPPVYEFSHHSDYVYATAAVWLFQHQGKPHWFATDGYSAMLTPALLDDQGTDPLFTPTVGQHCYRTQWIKDLFRHVKYGTVFYDTTTGNLVSPDGIMIVPPHEENLEPGEEPITKLPDVQKAFAGEEEAQSSFEFGWSFVSAVRSAFKAHSKDASLTMTCLENARVRVDIDQPYQGVLLISLSYRDLEHEEAPAVAEAAAPEQPSLQQALENLTDLPGLESVTINSGNKSVTLTSKKKSKPARLKEKLQGGADARA